MDFLNLDKPNDKTPKVWPLGGYAPGAYSCVCQSCGMTFTGDKRSWSCVACAVSGLQSQLEKPAPVTEPVTIRSISGEFEAMPILETNFKDLMKWARTVYPIEFLRYQVGGWLVRSEWNFVFFSKAQFEMLFQKEPRNIVGSEGPELEIVRHS